jgi:hypothetical protein
MKQYIRIFLVFSIIFLSICISIEEKRKNNVIEVKYLLYNLR